MTSLKKTLERVWFSLLLTTLICIGVSRVFRQENVLKERSQEAVTGVATKTEVTSNKPVTKSLSQLQDESTEGKIIDDNILFFNRVPKTGSEMFVLLLQWMQGINGFRHVRLPGGHQRRLDTTQQKMLAETIWRDVESGTTPMSFDRHVYFTNFTELGGFTPVYFNVVRDPVEKAVSRYYYGRVTPNPLNPDIKFVKSTTTVKPPRTSSFEKCIEMGDAECTFYSGQAYDLTIPYFCGQNRQCMILNDRWALAKAKQNIEQYYPVVGVLEHINATLSVLQAKLPKYFRGVSTMYYHELLEPHRNKNTLKPKVSPKVRILLKKKLSAEYDFYHWLKARLLRQAMAASATEEINTM